MWARVRRVVARSYGLPLNDARLKEWTDADYVREFAFIKVEQEGALLGSPEEGKVMSDDDFDAEVEMAAEGRWEELGLDALPEDFTPANIAELVAAED